MLEIPRFYGIVIAIFYRDHGPPHFHAIRGEFEMTVEIETGIVQGRFPNRGIRQVLEWMGLHQDELLEDWDLAKSKRPLKKIAPLGEES